MGWSRACEGAQLGECEQNKAVLPGEVVDLLEVLKGAQEVRLEV
jgi:hypothetical protein